MVNLPNTRYNQPVKALGNPDDPRETDPDAAQTTAVALWRGMLYEIQNITFNPPAGAATEAKQDVGNTSLAAIVGHVDGVETALGTLLTQTDGIEGALTSLAAATKVDDAAFTPATDRVVVMGAEADETSPDAVDEGDAGALRMTLSRALHTNLRNASGAEVTFGAGNVAASTLRVTLAADGPVASSTKVDDAAFTPGTDRVLMIGAEADETSADSVDEGDAGALRMTLARALHANLRTTSGAAAAFNTGAADSATLRVVPSTDASVGTTFSLTKVLTNAAVSISSSGDNTVISGVGGQAIRIYKLVVTAAAAVNVTLKSASTSLTGAMRLTADGSAIVLESNDGEPLFQCGTADAFIVNLSGAVALTGFVQYRQQ